MAAMDVVDTLRHQSDIAQRELDGQGRRDRLLLRLKDLYQAQGIDVPEHVLQEGIDALEQERFQYQAVEPSWRTRLAHIWVSRGRWGKPIGFLAVLASLFGGVYWVTDVLPERNMRNALPAQIAASVSTIKIIAKNPDVVSLAEQRASAAQREIVAENYTSAVQIKDEIAAISKRLQGEYSIRIVSRPGESSGVWRVPDINQQGKNYYLIVEAIDNSNRVLELDILSEETDKRKRVKLWGLRVERDVFQRVAADKQDDGIIQSNQIGAKKIGYLQPQYSIATSGASITKW
jgi:hypothetical protein